MIETSSDTVARDRANSAAAIACRSIYWGLTGLSLLSIALAFAYYLLGNAPFWGVWEDSFMLARYADHLIHGSGLIWNPGGPPTYGLTSVFYAGPEALVQSLWPNHPVLTLPLTSFLCGCLFLVLFAFLLLPILRGGIAVKAVVVLILAVSCGRASIALSAHFWSGMDTMFVISMLTGYFLLARWQERTATWASTVLMGFAGGLIYEVRPDLLIYSFLIPATYTLLAKDRRTRTLGFAALVLSAFTAACVLLFNNWYFGTALPLSFYAKGLKLYGDFEYERYRKIPFEQFADYLSSYVLLFGIVFLDLIDSIENRGRPRRSPFELALILGTALFYVYYLFFVLQIMEFNSRFYYPTLPALLWLSALSARRLVERYSNWFIRVFRKGSGWGWASAFALLGALLVAPMLAVNVHHVSRVIGKGFVTFDQLAEYRSYWQDLWFRLDRFSALPDDLVLATTEIGHVAALNPRKVVIDMAGLNESQFAKRPFSATALIEQYAPDLIYMPHPGYRSMNRDLISNPLFIKGYDYIPAASLGPNVKLGIALRRQSKYYPQMRAIIDEFPPSDPQKQLPPVHPIEHQPEHQ